MVEGTEGSHHKEGMTKMAKLSMVCAGIDIGKFKLDTAINGTSEYLQVDNSPEGHAALAAWLRRHRVKRVGMEASGGYEQPVMAALRRAGFVVVCLQPMQVRAYAIFKLQRAKNDRIDAALIATCTAAVAEVRPPPDPRFAALASRLTMIEQITEDVARLKTRCEACRDTHGLEFWQAEIARLKACIRAELKQLIADIRIHPDLAARLDLITSVDGVGLRTAVAVLIRMPEIGNVSREQAAALAGLAPYDDDSGSRAGQRHIAFGRERLRTSLYAAALPAAFKWNHQLVASYRSLTARGKPHKLALVACARKLIIFINTVVARGTPWIAKSAAI
ncbi:IS110 family transposase [Rhodopseudomonas sp. HC1]|uniref:IS110 family transposase n=1 Tax=Rhodopseudomonas infernalis TaxID=2897386 RepID=UPI001EE8E9CC|nr:IS110 family transposase [Rhodopseudomonas infernalis]MCG6207978.1 IS110 family transposase [Rhodopseudomonas infernalis]